MFGVCACELVEISIYKVQGTRRQTQQCAFAFTNVKVFMDHKILRIDHFLAGVGLTFVVSTTTTMIPMLAGFHHAKCEWQIRASCSCVSAYRFLSCVIAKDLK